MEIVKNKIIKDYDDYLSTLRHVSELRINRDDYKQTNGETSPKEVDSFVTPEIIDIHKSRIVGIINELLSNDFGFDKVRDVKTFIEYPDFKVQTYIDNIANLFNHNLTLEKCIIISPMYELNLLGEREGNNYKVIRIKRLQVSPHVNVFNIAVDRMNKHSIDRGITIFSEKFYDKYKRRPTKNDLIIITNCLIKYMVENLNDIYPNSMEVFYGSDSIVSYNYVKTKKEICDKYKVTWIDEFKRDGDTISTWINRGLTYFDNRNMILINDEPRIVPLEYQRLKK